MYVSEATNHAECSRPVQRAPIHRRFLQADPVGYDDQLNLYLYVGNDPVNATDPAGTYELRAASAAAARQWEGWFDRNAAGLYRFNNQLVASRVGNAAPGHGSQSYANDLDSIIASPGVMTVDVGEAFIDMSARPGEPAIRFLEDCCGGGITHFRDNRPDSVRIMVTGRAENDVAVDPNGSPLAEPPEDVAMHEVVTHGAAAILTRPDALTYENNIRRELGKPLRGTDQDHPQ